MARPFVLQHRWHIFQKLNLLFKRLLNYIGKRNSAKGGKKLRYWLIISVLIFFGCSSSSHPKKIAENHKNLPSESQHPKISPKISEVLQKLHSRETAREHRPAFRPSTLSSLLVKIDDEGNIQCYVHLNDTNEENLGKIKALLTRIELINQEQNIVQAWIPYDLIEEVASLDFVSQIRQPEYSVKLQ